MLEHRKEKRQLVLLKPLKPHMLLVVPKHMLHNVCTQGTPYQQKQGPLPCHYVPSPPSVLVILAVFIPPLIGSNPLPKANRQIRESGKLQIFLDQGSPSL